jgi:hypothetical protein
MTGRVKKSKRALKSGDGDLDADRLVLAKRIAAHAPPIQVDPDSARLVLVKLTLTRLLALERTEWS